MAVDKSGNAYLTGYTYASPTDGFPIVKAFQSIPYGTPYGYWTDGFVSKFDPTGAIVYSSFLGGGDEDFPSGIAVDGAGAAYVAGSTSSASFPSWSGGPSA